MTVRLGRVVALVLAGLLVVGACGSGGDDNGSGAADEAATTSSPEAVEPLPELRVDGAGRPAIVDPDGREVLLRGVNLNYPRAAPGRLTALRADCGQGLEVAGRGSGVLDLWVPDHGLGDPQVTGTGADRAEVAEGPGGWRITVPVAGRYEVTVA